MANDKYDSLATMMASGALQWQHDEILAVLLSGASFEAGNTYLSDVPFDLQIGRGVPVPGRSIAVDGSLLGGPVSFNRVPKDTTLQVVLVKNDGSSFPLLTYYDSDDQGSPLTVKNHGTFILRPAPIPMADIGDIQGVWVQP